MQDIIDKLAADVKRSTAEYCAKAAELHAIPRCTNDYQRGYNDAIRTVAAKIREMGK